MSPSTPTPAGSEETRAQLAYIGQMLWLISAQLHAAFAGGEYPVPDALSVLADRPGFPDPRPDLLARLKGDASS